MNRRRFLEIAGVASVGAAVAGCAGTQSAQTGPSAGAPKERPAGQDGVVYVGKNADPAKALVAAVAAAGGLKSVISPGATVALKPNAAWARSPEQAAATNPALVAQMIRLCREAGAGKVIVFEHTIDRPSQMVLGITGIAKAVGEAGGELVLASGEPDFQTLEVPRGKLLKQDTIAKTLAKADVIINMPKAKRHSQTELTLGLKNLMGCIWNRQAWHTGPDLSQYIADYATALPVSLTVTDASRVLLTNGPKGPGQTKDPNEVIVAFDPVAADAYACGLFDMKPADVAHIVHAAELGLGQHDMSKITVKRV